MPDVDLARRPGVELIRTGNWGALTGSWTPTRQDILAAVEAQQCPAVRRPRLKLGHTDTRFNGGGDGEPALGWFENLRTTDGGHTLVGDQMALPWLSQVQAAAYPDRSIEGNYNHVCSLGHKHPFVLTAVALLGVTPPAVSTLRSVQDLPAMLGVAAAEEVPDGARHVQVTIRAAAEVHTGAMVALIPTPEDAARLAVNGGEPAEQLHVTLAYLGESADLGAQGQQDVIDAVSSASNGLPTIEAEAFSLAIFNPSSEDRDPCIVLGLSGDLLDAVHDLIEEALAGAPIPEQLRPFAAHMTLEYTGDFAKLAALTDRTGPVTFDRLRIAFAGQLIDIPLIGQPDDPAEYADDPVMVAAAADENQLKTYWTKSAAGLAKWRDKPHPWTALYGHLKKFLGPERAKRTASEWYRLVFGHMPNAKKKGVKAGAGNGATPMPSRAELVRAAWNNSGAPVQKWVQEARPDAVVVVDDTDPASRSYELYPVSFDGDTVTFGAPQAYDPAADGALVFASAAESRPPTPAPDVREPAPAEPAEPVTPASALPAAEPEQENNPDPKEDPVSTDLSAFRSRLGLSDDADEQAILSALDAKLTQAEAPVEPTPEMVAASTATVEENARLTDKVQILDDLVKKQGEELAAIRAEKATAAKDAVLASARQQGKFKPADFATWEARYDKAPDVTTEILASIPVGAEVPVLASGVTGPAEPIADDMSTFEADMARLDGPFARKAV